MANKLGAFIFSALLLTNIYGCLALLAGAAGGTGTAVWLSEKLSQEVNYPLERSLGAAKNALKALRLNVEKETVKEDIAQVISSYTDRKTIWIDIRRISDAASRIDVRVGAVSDKEAARKILNEILRYL
jgi:hypothetical protein